uniref:Secreted protein n=1 Tax=Pinctada fucata TaxID=50426 RepID=A0A194AN61_PINFU
MDGIVIKVCTFLCFSALCNSLHIQTEATKTTNFLQRVVVKWILGRCLDDEINLGTIENIDFFLKLKVKLVRRNLAV